VVLDRRAEKSRGALVEMVGYMGMDAVSSAQSSRVGGDMGAGVFVAVGLDMRTGSFAASGRAVLSRRRVYSSAAVSGISTLVSSVLAVLVSLFLTPSPSLSSSFSSLNFACKLARISTLFGLGVLT
jgi:hypothetical protein